MSAIVCSTGDPLVNSHCPNERRRNKRNDNNGHHGRRADECRAYRYDEHQEHQAFETEFPGLAGTITIAARAHWFSS
jgi:hypothetical protein